MQKLRWHSASTGIQSRRFSMDHRVKPGGDDLREWLGIARVQRRAARTARYCERHKWREAIQSEALPWIAWSLTLLAMTSDLTSPPIPLFPAAGHPSPPRGDYLEG